jgi:hypothetical protein
MGLKRVPARIREFDRVQFSEFLSIVLLLFERPKWKFESEIFERIINEKHVWVEQIVLLLI